MVSTQFPANIKIRRFDSGREYQDHETLRIITSYRTLSHSSCLGTPEEMESVKGKIDILV